MGRWTRVQAGDRSTGGFTLVEVTLTLSVMVIVSVSTVTLLVPVSRQARLNRETEIANAEVRRILGGIQATPFSELTGRFPDGETVLVNDLPEGEVLIRYEDPAADPLRMRLTVSWESPDQGPVSWDFHTARTE